MMAKEEQRVVNHNFRTTEAEDALIRQKMQAYGIKNQSAFYRAIALNGYMLKLDLPEIREMIRLLKNLTNNVNQIARRLNEARIRGEALPWIGTGPTEVRALAGLIFSLADQIQDLSRNRRERLKVEVDKALAPLIAEVRDGPG